MRIVHPASGNEQLLTEANRVILPSRNPLDSAVIIFEPQELKFPQEPISLLPSPLPIGWEVGWLGFPSIESSTLCFFSGTISARHDTTYLIDGVAINGVSGGPVLCSIKDDMHVVGIITQYKSNQVSGSTLPGLAYAQDVSHFHDVVGTIRSLDEAEVKKKQAKQDQPPQA